MSALSRTIRPSWSLGHAHALVSHHVVLSSMCSMADSNLHPQVATAHPSTSGPLESSPTISSQGISPSTALAPSRSCTIIGTNTSFTPSLPFLHRVIPAYLSRSLLRSQLTCYSYHSMGDYAFEPVRYWTNVSETAKDFINRCLIVKPDKRPTAKELLEHPVRMLFPER